MEALQSWALLERNSAAKLVLPMGWPRKRVPPSNSHLGPSIERAEQRQVASLTDAFWSKIGEDEVRDVSVWVLPRLRTMPSGAPSA